MPNLTNIKVSKMVQVPVRRPPSPVTVEKYCSRKHSLRPKNTFKLEVNVFKEETCIRIYVSEGIEGRNICIK